MLTNKAYWCIYKVFILQILVSMHDLSVPNLQMPKEIDINNKYREIVRDYYTTERVKLLVPYFDIYSLGSSAMQEYFVLSKKYKKITHDIKHEDMLNDLYDFAYTTMHQALYPSFTGGTPNIQPIISTHQKYRHLLQSLRNTRPSMRILFRERTNEYIQTINKNKTYDDIKRVIDKYMFSDRDFSLLYQDDNNKLNTRYIYGEPNNYKGDDISIYIENISLLYQDVLNPDNIKII